MKRISFIMTVLFILLALLFTSCGGNGQNGDDTGKNTLTLDSLQGWWKRPPDYVAEGISVVNYFLVTVGDATVTVYDDFGNSGSSFPLSLEGNLLTVYMDEPFGEIVFTVTDLGTLCDENGIVQFVRGEEPVGTFSALDFNGRWLFNGEDAYIYTFSEGRYKVWRNDIEMEIENGGCYVGHRTFAFSDGREFEENYIMLETEDYYSSYGGEFLVLENLNVLYNTFSRGFLIRESLAETETGISLIEKYRLIRASWNSDNYTLFLETDGNVTVIDSEGSMSLGSWEFKDGAVVFIIDGVSQTVNNPRDGFTINGEMYSFSEPW